MLHRKFICYCLLLLTISCISLNSQTTIKAGATLVTVYSANLFFEGPTWDAVTQKLYFTTPNNSPYNVYRLDAVGLASVWMPDSQAINGMFIANDGRLLTAEQSAKRIGSYRIGNNGPEDAKVVAQNSAWNTPNDLCQTKRGDIYFTTPTWSATTAPQAVYRISTTGTVTQVVSNMLRPNGIIGSLDDTKLYVSDSDARQWMVFPLNADGSVGTGSVFFKPTSSSSNVPDGMTIDEKGNLYFIGLGGLWIVSPAGTQLDFISIADSPSNVVFGGVEQMTLYITCQSKVYSLETTVHGARWSGSTVKKGDVNGDNTITIVDALMIAQYSVGLIVAGFITAAADVNCSGTMDIVDALITAQYYVGLLSAFPC